MQCVGARVVMVRHSPLCGPWHPMPWARAFAVLVLVPIAILFGGCAADETRWSSARVFAHAAVAADHSLASQAGAQVLRQGGNAVDAAVATSLTLSVVRPYSCGLGGGGFMVIHLQDDPRWGTIDIAINYRETSPRGIDARFYERSEDPLASRFGANAVAVPGSIAGLLLALETYGTLDRKAVFAPAIHAAEFGFIVDEHYASGARTVIERFETHPRWKVRFAFVWKRLLGEGRIKRGDRIRLPEQARALRLIARDGARAFYEGPIAEAIERAVARDGGVLTVADLAAYEPRIVEPIRFGFYDSTLIAMPPPSSGGIAMAQILGILQRQQIDRHAVRANTSDDRLWLDSEPPARTHLMVEAFKHAFADRAAFLADADFVEVPIDRLLSDEYLDELASRVDPHATFEPAHYGSAGLEVQLPDDSGTSHLCVVDRWGSAVSLTETINLAFGSLLAVPEFGFVLNDEMDDFTTHRGVANAFGLVQSDRNVPEPGKRPLSSMSPTIVLDGNGRVLALAGASGGPRIITGTTQVLMRVLIDDAAGARAVGARRYHHQWMPNRVRVETIRDELIEGDAHRDEARVLLRATPDQLAVLGHEIKAIESVGVVQLIRRAVDGRGWEAASDPRKGGAPAGY